MCVCLCRARGQIETGHLGQRCGFQRLLRVHLQRLETQATLVVKKSACPREAVHPLNTEASVMLIQREQIIREREREAARNKHALGHFVESPMACRTGLEGKRPRDQPYLGSGS